MFQAFFHLEYWLDQLTPMRDLKTVCTSEPKLVMCKMVPYIIAYFI